MGEVDLHSFPLLGYDAICPVVLQFTDEALAKRPQSVYAEPLTSVSAEMDTRCRLDS